LVAAARRRCSLLLLLLLVVVLLLRLLLLLHVRRLRLHSGRLRLLRQQECARTAATVAASCCHDVLCALPPSSVRYKVRMLPSAGDRAVCVLQQRPHAT
jgi:hypothetical protein